MMKKTALLEKFTYGQRARAASHAGSSIEFSDLLDDVAPEQTLAGAKDKTDLSLADLVMFPVPHRFDADVDVDVDPVVAPVEDPINDTIKDTAEPTIEEIVAIAPKISRFAAGGIDDDLLPVRSARRRLRR